MSNFDCQNLGSQFYIADSSTCLDSQGDHNFIVYLSIDRMSDLHSEIVNLSTLTFRDNRANAPDTQVYVDVLKRLRDAVRI